MSHALVHLHRSFFVTDYLFAPFAVDLRLHTFGALYGVLSIPVTITGGPVLALNLQIFGTIALNGYTTFVLARYLTSDGRAAFLAGLLVAATPAINFHLVMGRVSCAALWPATLSVLCVLRLLDRPALWRAVLLILSLWAMLADDQQIALYGFVWLGLITSLVAPFRVQRKTVPGLLSAFALTIVCVAPLAYWLFVQPFTGQVGYSVPAASEAATYSYPARLLWTPSMIWRVYGTILPLGLIAAVPIAASRPSILPWLAGAALCVSMSLGPSDANAAVGTPFDALRRIPGMAQFRTPYRFQIPAALGAAICVAFVTAWLGERVRRSHVLMFLLAGVAVIDMAAYRALAGFPLQTRRHHPVYATLAARHDARPILEVPVGVRTGTDLIGTGETLNFEQPVHQRRLINGMIARVPLEALNYYQRSPALMFLGDQADAPASELSADLTRVLDELDVSYVVVHPQMLSERRRQLIVSLIEQASALRKIHADAEILVFRRD